MGLLLQIADSGKLITDSGRRLAAVVSIAGVSLLLQFKRICSGMPISAQSTAGGLLLLKNREQVSSGEYGKTLAVEMIGISAISYL
jgi:hypothetical protein